MTIKTDLVEQMLGLHPEQDGEKLRVLTRELTNYRVSPTMERDRFEGTRSRGITGYSSADLPRWERVLVTGGTGCVGHVVLKSLVHDLPDARLASLARRNPAPERQLKEVTYARGDVRNAKEVTEAMRRFQPDLVIHLAAQRNPALAEVQIAETVSTNVVGSQIVLDAAVEAGVGTVVIASTGKAVRLYTGDVYAATKMLVEYQCAIMAKQYDTNISCTRFTHVVDNSLVGVNILKWIAADEPILLHSPLVQLPVQSALECYQLLMTAGIVADRNRPKVVALRNLGWPPIALLDLTLDYLADSPSSQSHIEFTGYPPGYEAEAYPGTYDPLSAGEVSPLVNCIEAMRTSPTPVFGDFVDHFDMTDAVSDGVLCALDEITGACRAKPMDDRVIGDLLRNASVALFQHRLERADPERVDRIHHFGRRHDPLISDHAYIHRRLQMLLNIEDAVLV